MQRRRLQQHQATIRRILFALFPDRAANCYGGELEYGGNIHRRREPRHRVLNPIDIRNAVFRALYSSDGDQITLITRYLFDEIAIEVKVTPSRETFCHHNGHCPDDCRYLSIDEIASCANELSHALHVILTSLRSPQEEEDAEDREPPSPTATVIFSQRHWSYCMDFLLMTLGLMCVKFTIIFERLPYPSAQAALSLHCGNRYSSHILVRWCVIRWKFFILRRRRDATSRRCARCARDIFRKLRKDLRTVSHCRSEAQITISSRFVRLYRRTMLDCDTNSCNEYHRYDDRDFSSPDVTTIDLSHYMIGVPIVDNATDRDYYKIRRCSIEPKSFFGTFYYLEHLARDVAYEIPDRDGRTIQGLMLNLYMLPVVIFSLFGENHRVIISYDRKASVTFSRYIKDVRTLPDYSPQSSK